ncbi:MAG: 6-bladed beta-propeller [Verrucomicrobiaceae bacterium]|nr:6-bladed beta-propeller [Verrucomicrobiaceae bacterium]
MNRPDFVTTRRSLLTAAASMVVAPYVRSESKTAPEFHGQVVGHGGFQYRVDKLWSKADPATHPVKDCHEMVQASDGRLFLLTNQAKNNVLIYDVAGALLGAWTIGFRGAHGLTLHREAGGKEFLYITDASAGRVVKTTLEGEIVLEIEPPTKLGQYSERESFNPTETAIGPNGDIYIADGYGSQWISRYDKSGKFISKFGGKSTQPINGGKFMQAHGVALDTRGPEPLLVCTERIRNEFNWFTLEGQHVRGVYLPGAYVSRPVIAGRYLYSGVCFGAKPDDYRMWQGRGFVTILDDKDQVVSNPGGLAPVYEGGRLKVMLQDRPVFNNCHDVCVDSAGDLYVCQWNSGNVYPYKLHREA